MQSSTSLTFFTAISVAFSGALAEELMIFCRHVRTELYIYIYIDRQFEAVFFKPQPLSLKQLAKEATVSIYTPKMQIIHISIEGVDKLLQGLSPNKASCPDEISPNILKELHHEIAPILSLIFNLSLETRVIPLDWRTADVVPVSTNGCKSKASNYRPTSLTSIASKLLEHILVSNSMSHFDDNHLLSQYQHGFRS